MKIIKTLVWWIVFLCLIGYTLAYLTFASLDKAAYMEKVRAIVKHQSENPEIWKEINITGIEATKVFDGAFKHGGYAIQFALGTVFFLFILLLFLLLTVFYKINQNDNKADG